MCSWELPVPLARGSSAPSSGGTSRWPRPRPTKLGRLALGDALCLLLLIAEKAPEKFERAAVRWVGRFAVETSGVRVPDLQLLLGAVAGLREPAPRVSLETIATVADRFRVGSVATTARRLAR